MRNRQTVVWRCGLLALAVTAAAADWPEWRGKGRTGTWNETGILETFPKGGLPVRWRTPIGAGFAGPAVAEGRVFVTDFQATAVTRGVERAIALDEKTGKILWQRSWDADYKGISYAYGPRATPTVDGDRVYVVGASGILHCLDTRSGAVLWRRDYVRDFGTEIPVWGIAGAPIVDGPRLIAIVGGQPRAKLVAFDKLTGKEIWRALPADSEPGYSQPVIIESNNVRQLIVWHSSALESLDPATGANYWRQPFRVNLGVTLSTPVYAPPHLLVSCFYNGSLLMEVAGKTARVLWQGKSSSEIDTDGLHTVVNTPAVDGEHIYGICSYGQFRCLNLRTGARVWETLDVTREKARWASGFIVRHRDRYFINNDRGELILARLSARGYEEIGRTQLIKPTSNPGNRRELGVVNWSHPAYANGYVVARNDEEIVSLSLAGQ
jgi:outer membrane protein assembly factor BamB